MTTVTVTSDRTEACVSAPVDFRTLQETHGPRALALAYRVTRDRELAADAVQEAFLAAWRTKDTFDAQRGTMSSWFLTIVHRRAVDQVRSATYRNRVSQLEDAERLPTQATGPEDHAVRADRNTQVRAALDRLPPAQRQAVQLAYFGGYSQSQIAGLLGVPLGTVKTRKLCAIRRLRAMVPPES